MFKFLSSIFNFTLGNPYFVAIWFINEARSPTGVKSTNSIIDFAKPSGKLT